MRFTLRLGFYSHRTGCPKPRPALGSGCRNREMMVSPCSKLSPTGLLFPDSRRSCDLPHPMSLHNPRVQQLTVI